MQGASGLEGQLKEDFNHLVQQHRQGENSSNDSADVDKEELCMLFYTVDLK